MNDESRSGRWPYLDDASAWLRSIVDHSQDAILSKTLDGIITSWNTSAERLFGFTAEEAIGKPITIIIPEDRLHEEDAIIARLREGESIDRMETVRRAKDGSSVNIEVSISPVRDARGTIIGASKIVHDIGERLRFAEAQALVVREMQHRVKNLLSVVQALIWLGSRSAGNVEEFTAQMTERIGALAATQQLVLNEARHESATTLGMVLSTLLAPYASERVVLDQSEIPVGPKSVTSLALLLHELATNAAKYGGLSTPDGKLTVQITENEEAAVMRWTEHGGNPPDPDHSGFGSNLISVALRGLGAREERSWNGQTLEILLEFDRDVLAF